MTSPVDPTDLQKDEQEHQQAMESALLAFRIRMATVVVSLVLFLAAALLIWDVYAQAKNIPYAGVPIWFIDICKLAIEAGLVAFFLGASGAIRQIRRLKKRENDNTNPNKKS